MHSVKYPGEVDGKSTAIHAKLLAPDHVSIYAFPEVPDIKPDEYQSTVLLFPSAVCSYLSFFHRHIVR